MQTVSAVSALAREATARSCPGKRLRHCIHAARSACQHELYHAGQIAILKKRTGGLAVKDVQLEIESLTGPCTSGVEPPLLQYGFFPKHAFPHGLQ